MGTIFTRKSFISGWVFGFLVIFFIPHEVGENKFVFEFINFMREHVPFIGGYWMRSEFPGTSVFYFSLQWIIFLPAFLDLLKNKDLGFDKNGFLGNYEKFKGGAFPKLKCLLAITFCMMVVLVSWFQPGYDFGFMPVNKSKLFLAFFGPLIGFFPIYLFLSISYCYFLFILKIYKS